MNTQFKKGVLEMCVLSLIHQKDRYGYEIVERISHHIEVTEGTIYPLLRRLVNESYVTTYLSESSVGPTRKYYRISKTGKKRYEESRRDWIAFVKNVDEITRSEADKHGKSDESAESDKHGKSGECRESGESGESGKSNTPRR